MESSSEEDPMAWTTDDIPDLSGRAAIVTGASGGLGFELALILPGLLWVRRRHRGRW